MLKVLPPDAAESERTVHGSRACLHGPVHPVLRPAAVPRTGEPGRDLCPPRLAASRTSRNRGLRVWESACRQRVVTSPCHCRAPLAACPGGVPCSRDFLPSCSVYAQGRSPTEGPLPGVRPHWGLPLLSGGRRPVKAGWLPPRTIIRSHQNSPLGPRGAKGHRGDP